MKFAILLDHDPGLLNGASRQAAQFIEWLLKRGHEIHLVHTASGGRPAAPRPGLTVSTVPSLSVAAYREYRIPVPPLAVRLWLSPRRVDIVHAETMNPTLLALGYRMKRSAGAPMYNVLTTNLPFYASILLPREGPIKTFVYRVGKPMMNAVSNRIEGTFVLSEGMRDALTRNFYRIDPARVFTWTRPLDPAAFAARNGRSTVWDRLGIPRGGRLATLSRLCRTKNVEFLIQTFARELAPRDPSLHLVVAGEGPLEGDLRGLAAKLGCDRVHFPGLIPYDQVPDFLAGADGFLFSSLSETFGNAVCEAKYAGVPVVALDDGGGVRSQIVDRLTGVLVADADEKLFAERVMELRRDEALRERIRHEARRDVVVRHSPDRIYGGLMEVYERSVGGLSGARMSL
ncbi:MAG: glycosyltransferase [Candidatus Aminicenantes bacterium]|nr:glycosyltransferase [Candidatus Aminicenantes bacterium]